MDNDVSPARNTALKGTVRKAGFYSRKFKKKNHEKTIFTSLVFITSNLTLFIKIK